MKHFSLLIGGALAVCLASSALADEKVKVRLKTKTQNIALTGFQIQMPYDKVGRVQTSAFDLRKIKLKRILQEGRMVWEISDNDLSEKVFWREEPLKFQGEMMRQGVEPLPQSLIFFPLDTKDFDVVAEIGVESYLEGVLPSEMPSSWPMEALKAQVVASRSYMYSLMKERKNMHFHLESTIFDQVYKHSARVDASAKVRNRMKRAIRETRGNVLYASSGEILRSFYHADCGGRTEEPKYVWGMTTKNGTVEDATCPASPQARWELDLSRASLKKYLASYYDSKTPLNFKSLHVSQRTPSGRVAELEVLLNEAQSLKLSAQELRKLLGFNRLKSTNFQLHWYGDKLKIEGLGHGHGVGMCQWGARSLAQRGTAYKDILKRYYPYSRIGQLTRPQNKPLPIRKITAQVY